jgi:hypothetical protein
VCKGRRIGLLLSLVPCDDGRGLWGICFCCCPWLRVYGALELVDRLGSSFQGLSVLYQTEEREVATSFIIQVPGRLNASWTLVLNARLSKEPQLSGKCCLLSVWSAAVELYVVTVTL